MKKCKKISYTQEMRKGIEGIYKFSRKHFQISFIEI
jgi:hypothetical protein